MHVLCIEQLAYLNYDLILLDLAQSVKNILIIYRKIGFMLRIYKTSISTFLFCLSCDSYTPTILGIVIDWRANYHINYKLLSSNTHAKHYESLQFQRMLNQTLIALWLN